MPLLTTPICNDGERIGPASHAGTILGRRTKRTAADAFNDTPTSRDDALHCESSTLVLQRPPRKTASISRLAKGEPSESGICADCARLDFESIMQKTQGDLPKDGLPLCSFGKRLSRINRCAVCALFTGVRTKDKLNYWKHPRVYNPGARRRSLYDAGTQEYGLVLGGTRVPFLAVIRENASLSYESNLIVHDDRFAFRGIDGKDMPGEAAGMFFDVLTNGDRSQYGEALILIDGHHYKRNKKKQKLVLMLLKQTGPDQYERAGLLSHRDDKWDASFVKKIPRTRKHLILK
jgi:hypothetical protein